MCGCSHARRLVIAGGALLIVGLFAGCRGIRPSSHAAAEASAYWQPHRLLLSDARHRRLFVEIDAVAGTEPSPEDVAALKGFLSRHCRKPDGVSVVIDDVISREAARGKLSRLLALEHMDGPADPDSACLYLLFFDSKIAPDRKSQPVCLLTPYPGAILVDHRYVRARIKRQRVFRTRVLLHETGHALGLCREATHSDGLHCTNEGCLMNPSLYLSMLRLFFGGDVVRQKEFCPDCLEDLATEQQHPPAENLGYHGPWFVRSETGYHVLTRPNMVYVQIGALSGLDDRSLEDLRATALAQIRDRDGVSYSASTVDREGAAGVAPLLLKDPVFAVRRIGEELMKRLAAEDAEPAPAGN